MRNTKMDTMRDARSPIRTIMRAIGCVLFLAASAAQAQQATAVWVSNAKAAPRDAKSALVSFDVNWHYSWRYEGTHDALWVFFKVRPEGSTEWQPVHLAADKVRNPVGYGQESGPTLEFLVPDDKGGAVGMFVRRAEYGYGLVCATNVTAVWDFTANKGVGKDVKVEVLVSAVEMVYIPEAAFYLGTGELMPFRFYQYTDGTQNSKPYPVTSEGAIPTGQQDGKLWARLGAQPEDKGEIPAAYPKGYGAVYCMKSHIKGGEYHDFLRSLTAEQMARYCPTNFIVPKADAVYSGAEKTRIRPYSPLSWGDGIGYAAWAGLRPMSELEYVKIGRGTMDTSAETGDTLDHPSCWGVLDWTGWRAPRERAVNVATTQGRTFKGTHGDGTLAVPADWPQEDAVGSGILGGYGPINGHPSTRTEADRVAPERAVGLAGWRGVRTAPKEAAE
jgi:hypothetical protein